MMPYFLRHYETFANRIVLYDDGSDDGTREIIESHPLAELKDYPLDTGIDDQDLIEFAESIYPEARGQADWVIWVDADEIIYHPELANKLQEYLDRGVKVPMIGG